MSECILLVAEPAKVALVSYVEQLAPRLARMAGFYARRTRLDREDLLQEAWQGLIEGWQKMDERIGTPRHYLVQCAKWRMLSYCRKMRRRVMGAIEQEVMLEDGELMAADLRIDLEEAQGMMRPVQREVVGCLLAGMTWREAGERLGCSSANVAYHMRQIRMLLSNSAA